MGRSAGVKVRRQIKLDRDSGFAVCGDSEESATTLHHLPNRRQRFVVGFCRF